MEFRINLGYGGVETFRRRLSAHCGQVYPTSEGDQGHVEGIPVFCHARGRRVQLVVRPRCQERRHLDDRLCENVASASALAEDLPRRRVESGESRGRIFDWCEQSD